MFFTVAVAITFLVSTIRAAETIESNADKNKFGSDYNSEKTSKRSNKLLSLLDWNTYMVSEASLSIPLNCISTLLTNFNTN